MLLSIFIAVVVLVVLATLPYLQPASVLDEDDDDEPAKLRLKPTRQR